MPKEFYRYIERSEKSDEVGLSLTEALYDIYEECVLYNNGQWNEHGNEIGYLDRLEAIYSSSEYIQI